MPEFVSAPIVEPWYVTVACPKCEYVYRYFEDDVLMDTFKVSGYDFDGTADWQMKPFVYCGNCNKEITLKDVPKRVIERAPREKGFGK